MLGASGVLLYGGELTAAGRLIKAAIRSAPLNPVPKAYECGLHFLCHTPQWDGRPILGKTLLIWGAANSGLGDWLELVRLLPRVTQRSQGPVWLWTHRGMGPLFSGLADRVLYPPLPDGFDYHLPFILMPAVCPLTDEAGKPDPARFWNGPYLTPDPEAVARWAPRF
jgi:hypothetical protein